MSEDIKYVLEPGQRIFKINIETGVVESAKFTLVKVRGKKNEARVKEKDGFIHLPAYNKNHASVLYKNIIAKAQSVCSVCGAEGLELTTCERCENNHCINCQAPYNQFTQIDFDCCKTCENV